MTRVLLTGGTGFVGRQILKCLIAHGCTVRLSVRNKIQNIDNVEQIVVNDLFAASNYDLVKLCSDIDLLIHAAWYATPGSYLDATENLECLKGTVNLARAAVQAGVKRFVGIGTCFEYDVSGGYLKTSTPLAPSTLYGACKASAFMTLSQLMANEQKSFSWCRLFYLYGEGENEGRLVPYIRARLSKGERVNLTHGNQVRDYMDVSEAGRQIADTALSGLEGPINICSGSPITVAKFAYQIADSYKRPDLIILGAKADNPRDPACVFGEPNRKISVI